MASNLYKNAIVEKRNVLNELRSNNMTLQELRFFSIYLSKINPWDKSTRVVTFSLSDFQKIMDFGKLNLQQLRNSTDSLLRKIVNIPDESGGYTGFTLFKKCRVYKNDFDEWFVEINASDDALPLMFDFKNRYFTYELWNALRLKSANQVRMYEILKQYEKLGRREIAVSDLRELLGIAPNEYDRFGNFKVKVLDSCQQALAENTDICYTYERGKTGRGGKWLTIVFHISKNENYVDQLTLDEFIDLQGTQNAVYAEDNEEMLLAKYGDETLATLAEGVNAEFSKEEMEEIRLILIRIDIPKDRYLSGTAATLYGRQRYLSEKYAALNTAAENKVRNGEQPIKNRFQYFKKMLEEDTFEPLTY